MYDFDVVVMTRQKERILFASLFECENCINFLSLLFRFHIFFPAKGRKWLFCVNSINRMNKQKTRTLELFIKITALFFFSTRFVLYVFLYFLLLTRQVFASFWVILKACLIETPFVMFELIHISSWKAESIYYCSHIQTHRHTFT